MMMPLERIQKILAQAGIASRREAERLILEGRVRVNGRLVDALGAKADPSKDHIKVDGKRIGGLESKVAILLNKPRNFLSTAEDPQGRPTVMDLCKTKKRVYPVGRLDFDAEGLLILTNDGELANTLTHPRYEVLRTYLAKVIGVPEGKDLNRLKKGVLLEDGMARVVSCRVIGEKEKHSWVRVVVAEGRNHLVKRILSAIGHPVLKLKRIGFGPVQLGNLPIGQFRYLTPEEIEKIKSAKVKAKGKSEDKAKRSETRNQRSAVRDQRSENDRGGRPETDKSGSRGRPCPRVKERSCVGLRDEPDYLMS
jgi:23S rRNA pseudouridine2605 synthase